MIHETNASFSVSRISLQGLFLSFLGLYGEVPSWFVLFHTLVSPVLFPSNLLCNYNLVNEIVSGWYKQEGEVGQQLESYSLHTSHKYLLPP